MMKKKSTLKEKILDEMTVDYANALERNFELAKRFVRITSEGKIHVLTKDKLTGIEQILLYAIGKLYAKEAELSPVESVTNRELAEELGLPVGSVLPWLKELRDTNRLRALKKGVHVMPINRVEPTLRAIEEKIREGKK